MTGISVSRALQLSGVSDFLILEKQELPGGLCRTKKIGGHTLDIGGGHFLCTKYDHVYKFIFNHIGVENFNKYDRVSKIEIENNIIDYPVESNIWQLPKDLADEYLKSIKQSGQANSHKEPKNFSDWVLWKLGSKIAEKYMLPYNEKIWGVDVDTMDVDWLQKIPNINVSEIENSFNMMESDISKMPSHQYFYYPKQGGFQVIFDAILDPVKNNLITQYHIDTIEKRNEKWVINNEIEAENIINTAPWPVLMNKFTGDYHNIIKKNISKLKSNSIVVSLHDEVYDHNYHWKYDPDITKDHHREFYIPNFAADSKANGLYRETNIKRYQIPSKHSRQDSTLYHHINEVAYPIPVIGHAAAINSVMEVMKKGNCYGVGRWGQWKYLNSDVCIHEAMKLVCALENIKIENIIQ